MISGRARRSLGSEIGLNSDNANFQGAGFGFYRKCTNVYPFHEIDTVKFVYHYEGGAWYEITGYPDVKAAYRWAGNDGSVIHL